MRHSMVKLALPTLAVMAVAGCATMGTGTGSTLTGKDPVSFSWRSTNDSNGTMTAAAADGKSYSGQYFQITRDTTVDTLGPLWVGGWRRGWGWRDWDAGPAFITNYTGRVVANLAEPGGAHMRCKFQLASPSSGMAGGGHGQCQLPDGNTIDATFPRA